MSHNLLKGKRGIIFGALNSESIAWKVAEKAVEEGAIITLSNTPMALRMGELNELSEKLNAPIIPADATSVEDLQKVFEERYYYWADKLGYITWGEEASWGLDVINQEATGNFIREWQEIVARDRNHPSLVAWTPLNETWGANSWLYNRFVTNVYDITKAMDPTRPVNDASGDSHVKTDLWTVHDYTREYDKLVEHHTFKDGKPVYRNVQSKPFLAEFEGQPYMIDEFGGLGWIPKEERANSWGYGAVIETEDDFFRILEQEVDAIKACKKVVGFCYTQITDVEQEKNGVYYYDRRPKFDAAKWKAIFEKIPSYIEIEE